jgi:hypothetical protein
MKLKADAPSLQLRLSEPRPGGQSRNYSPVRPWESIALSASGLSWGCSSEINATGRVLYTADAYRKDRKRFTVIAKDKLTAFLEIESALQTFK